MQRCSDKQRKVQTLPTIRIQFCSGFLEHRRQNHNHGFIMDPPESDGELKRDPVDPVDPFKVRGLEKHRCSVPLVQSEGGQEGARESVSHVQHDK